MKHLSKEQIRLLDLIIMHLRCLRSSNDIESPTIHSDFDEDLKKLVSTFEFKSEEYKQKLLSHASDLDPNVLTVESPIWAVIYHLEELQEDLEIGS